MLDIFWPIIGSMARHGLTAFAGYLVAVGLLPQAQANGFVAALLLLIGLGWSAWHKINTPEGLTRLMARMKDKNVKAAWAGDLMRASPNVVAVLAVSGIILAGLLSSAHAQQITVRHKPGGPKIISIEQEPMKAGLSSLIQQVSPIQLNIQGPDQLWAGISKVALDDLQTALANASSVNPPTNASKARVACYSSLVALIAAQSSAAAATSGQAVGTGVFTHFERLAQLNEALQPGSAMQVACAPVAQGMRLQLAQFLTSVTAGGLSLAKFGLLP